MLGKEVINDKPLTGKAAQMVREEAKKVLEERNKKKRIIKLNIMTKEEAKHLSDVLKAYSEGKSIEQQVSIGKWQEVKDLTDNVAYEFAYPNCFRIKPEPKYRPYKNAEEFLKAQKEHGPYLHNSYGYIIPIGVYDNTVICPDKNGHEDSFEVLKDGYTWQDGHPCGITEE